MEEGKKQGRSPETCKRPQTSLAIPLHPATPCLSLTLATTRFNPFSFRKMSESVEGQPGDVRSRHFYPHYLNFLTTFLRQSPHLRNQPGLSSSNRALHTPQPLFSLLIRSAGLQTSRAISPRSLPRPSFSPLFRLRSFPVHPSLFGTSFCVVLIISPWLACSVLVRASRALRRDITRQNVRRSCPPCSQMVYQYTQGPIHLAQRNDGLRKEVRRATSLHTDAPLTVMARPLNPVLGEYVIRSGCCGLRI